MPTRSVYVAVFCAAATAMGCQAFLSIEAPSARRSDADVDASTNDGDGALPVGDASAQTDGVVLVDSASVDGSSSAYADQVMSDGPEAYLRFDEAAGATQLADVMGKHGTVPNVGATLGLPGALGRALGPTSGDTFLGGAIVLEGRAGVTVEALAYLDDAEAKWEVRLGDTADGFDLITGYVDVGSPQGFFSRHCCGLYHKAMAAAPTQRFFHVAGVYDGAVLRVYIDGKEAGTANSTNALIASSWSPYLAVYSGARIDELAIYTKALAPERILAHCKASGLCP